MRGKSRRKLLVTILLVAVVLYCVWGAWMIRSIMEDSFGQNTSGRHTVALVTKSSTSAFWKSVYAGARAAGTEYNLALTFASPENEEDYETQNELIAQAVEDGAEVIVFSSVDYEENAAAIDAAAAQGVKIIVIDSDVNSDNVSIRIGTNNYEAGALAGEAALACEDEVLNVGIVNYDVSSANGQEREAGFRDTVAGDTRVQIVETINVLSTTEDALEGAAEMLLAHPEINVIVTFNEWTSLGVGYAIQALGLGNETTVVAFDSNVISVSMLETGEVDALIVQNPYAMGYLGVEYAYNLLNGKGGQEEEIETATTLITRENMFEEDSQRLLFVFE